MPRYLRIGIIVAIVGGFALGFAGPGYRVLRAIGIKSACIADYC